MKSLVISLLLLLTSSCLSEADEIPTATSNQSEDASAGDDGSGDADPFAALHDGKQTCDGCHEKDRPTTGHPPSGDCYDCHAYPTWDFISR